MAVAITRDDFSASDRPAWSARDFTVNTDQGVQFTSAGFLEELEAAVSGSA
jgi:hypothetical protein